MPGFLDKLDMMVVNTVSPDRVAKVRFHRRDGIQLEWGSRGLRNLNAEQVSGEVTKAVVAALEGAERGTELAREAVRTKDDTAVVRRPNPEKAERRRLLRRGIEELHVTSSAAQGYVNVDWRNRTDVEVRIAAGALNRFDEETLRTAVNEALRTALTEHNQAVANLFVDIYKFDQFGQKWKDTA